MRTFAVARLMLVLGSAAGAATASSRDRSPRMEKKPAYVGLHGWEPLSQAVTDLRSMVISI